MGKPKKVSDTRVKAALKKRDGMIGLAAKDLGLARQSLHERVNNSIELQQFLIDLDTQIVDEAQHQAYKKVRKGDGPMIRYVLDAKGRARGFGKAPEGPPPPPPDNGKRGMVINMLVQNLNLRAGRAAAKPSGGQAVNGHAKPGNGSAALLVAARKANGHG